MVGANLATDGQTADGWQATFSGTGNTGHPNTVYVICGR
jgi:hypothetical protein